MIEQSEKRIEIESPIVKRATEQIHSSDLRTPTQDKIIALLKDSPFRQVYAGYILADDPEQFRASLPENQKFWEQVESLGLNVEILKNGIEDTGVEIEVDPEASALLDNAIERWCVPLAEAAFDFLAYFKSEEVVSEAHYQKEDPDILISDAMDLLVTLTIDPREPKADWITPLFTFMGVDSTLVETDGSESDVSLDLRMDQNLKTKTLEYLTRELTSSEIYEKLVDAADPLLAPSPFAKYEKKIILDTEKIEQQMLKFHHELSNFAMIKASHFIRDKLEIALTPIMKFASNLDENKKLDVSTLNRSEKRELLKGCRAISKIDGLLKTLYNENVTTLRELNGNFAQRFREATQHLRLSEGQLDETQRHLSETDSDEAVSSKIRRKTKALYTVKKEPLPPEDVVFGNNGGACIAVSDNETSDQSKSVPFYILDEATQVFGIYQHIGERKPARVGFVLSHIGVDQDNDPIQLINSYEFSSGMNPMVDTELTKLVEHVTGYLFQYNEEAGIARLAMGTHGYNTGKQYLDKEWFLKNEGGERILKLPSLNSEDNRVLDSEEPYSEVLKQRSDGNFIDKIRMWSFIIPE